MHGEPPYWTRGRHRQNSASGGGKVHKCMRTHGSEGATEPGRDGPGPVGPSRPAWPSEDHVWFEDLWMVASLCDE
jgi:hypothetical protein